MSQPPIRVDTLKPVPIVEVSIRCPTIHCGQPGVLHLDAVIEAHTPEFNASPRAVVLGHKSPKWEPMSRYFRSERAIQFKP